MAWYYAKNGRQLGPVELPELRGQVAAGNLGPDDLVWTAGMQAWTPIGEVPEINSSGTPSQTVLPSSAYSAHTVSGAETWRPTPYPVVEEVAFHSGYAGFWLRAAAFLIDAIVQVLVGGVLAIALVLLGFDLENLGGPGRLLDLAVGWLYYSLCESSSAQGTVGKIVLGLKVTDMEGKRISFLRATGRHFGKILSTIVLFFGFIMAGFTEKKQALHDMLASCLVVRR